MNTHVHPKSNEPIQGIRLGRGAVIQETDLYDSMTGNWEPMTPHAGIAIQSDKAGAIIVRPNATLSGSARFLLIHLMNHGFFLIERGPNVWHMIPSVASKAESGHYVRDARAAADLVAYGYVAPTREDPEVFEPTETGKEAVSHGD